jgi:hypothetical protein
MDDEVTPPADRAGDDQEQPLVPDLLAVPPQTPLYRAFHLSRYRRQELIKAIQETTGRQLICYIAEGAAAVTRDDVMPLMDLLHNVSVGTSIDFMLQTSGGDIDAAVKIVGVLRRRVASGGQLRVVVPDYAKSAGTLIALGADAIVMSDSSELGPIDPQIVSRDSSGNPVQRPAHTYVDGYDALVTKIDDPDSYAGGKNTDAERQLLAKYDPALLDLCRQALLRSVQLAESLLKQGMLREGAWTKVALDLTDNKRWLSQHGAVINVNDAQSMGLRVEYLSPDSAEWQAYWRLYCEQRLSLGKDNPKLFESDFASIPFA